MSDFSEDPDLNFHQDLPVFKKANDILNITFTLSDIIDRERDQLRLSEQMLNNALVIPAKIAGAEGADIYSIRFDNATLIKLAARELLSITAMMAHEELCDRKYIKLLREEIEEFRILFLNWVRSFDKNNDIEDEWDIKNL